MTCSEIRKFSNAYADQELELLRAAEVERHLNGCRSCSQEVENIRALSSALKSSELHFRAPARLKGSIRTATIGKTSSAQTPRRADDERASWTQWLRWLIPVAAAAIVFLAVVFVPSGNSRLTEEAVAGHVRSMMANHLTDIASSDQHTVKPWFDGKVDFAPPIVDLAARGYPLIGGRLDYLQNRPVAAAVYQRQKHIINLFIWPAAGNRNTRKKVSVGKGYNVISWDTSGMSYCAVSDLNAVELREFADLMK
jgi:anti-sigma factor RsiW